MPLIGKDYQKGYIYGIYFNDQLLYIGSSCAMLAKRRYEHKCFTHKLTDKSTPLHRYINENVPDMWNNQELRIEQIEKFPCADKNELNRREGILIREMTPLCNKNIAGRTQAEYKKIYRESNKDKINESQKIYRESNKDKINESQKIYNKTYREKKRRSTSPPQSALDL